MYDQCSQFFTQNRNSLTNIIVNALVPYFTKGIVVNKALQEPQYQKHKKWHLLDFSAHTLQKMLAQRLVERQSNAAVLLSNTDNITNTFVSVFDFSLKTFGYCQKCICTFCWTSLYYDQCPVLSSFKPGQREIKRSNTKTEIKFVLRERKWPKLLHVSHKGITQIVLRQVKMVLWQIIQQIDTEQYK